MELLTVGTGTAVPDGARGPTGLVVRSGGGTWLVDGGSGTVGRCARFGVDPVALDGGLYSHRHPDHTGDLVPLLFAMRVGRRRRDYPIWAGTGFAAFLDGLAGVYAHWITPGAGRAHVHELSLTGPDQADLGPIQVHTRPAAHGAGALHLAFHDDRHRVVFSGDTGPSDALVALAQGADLLVCECGSSDAVPLEDHLSPAQVADLVDAARPREVWLTHFYPGSDPEGAVATVARTGVRVRRPVDGDWWRG